MSEAIFTRDLGTDPKTRLRLTVRADKPDVIDLRLVEALGSSGVFSPTARGAPVPLATVPALIEGLWAARETAEGGAGNG